MTFWTAPVAFRQGIKGLRALNHFLQLSILKKFDRNFSLSALEPEKMSVEVKPSKFKAF